MMRKIAFGILMLGFVFGLSACSTSAVPIISPPPQGNAHDQTTGVHRALSPLYDKDLKNPPPYLDVWHHGDTETKSKQQ